MNAEISKESQENLKKLINSMQLRSIQFIDIHSNVTSASVKLSPQNNELKISWNQTFANEDPVFMEDKLLLFRPKYEFSIGLVSEEIFHATMIASMQFSFVNKADFDESWANEEVRKTFQQKQIMRTMWTILRQQLMDCMNRHSLPSITLPWIV